MTPDSPQEPAQLTIVPFLLGGLRAALYLSAVTKVLRSVSVFPLPGAPSIVTGVVDVHGTLVPAINLRKRFHLPARAVEPTDQMLLAQISDWDQERQRSQAVALVVDSVQTALEVRAAEVASAKSLVPNLDDVDGIAQLSDGLLLIYDLDRCLSLSEGKALEAALETETNA